MNSRSIIVLILLAALNFTHILDFMIMMPLGNYLMPAFDISSGQFSMLVAAYTFSAAVSGFLAAFFIDRFDRKSSLLIAYSGFLVGTLLCALSPSYEILLLSRIAAGAFGGLIGSQVLTIVSDLIPYERRGLAMSVVMLSFSIASVVGVPFGLVLANKFNWHGPFFFVAGFGLVLIPFILRFIPKLDTHIADKALRKVSPVELLKNVSKDKDQVFALASTATMMFGHFIIIPFLNPYMEFNKGFSKEQTPLVYFVGGLATLLTSQALGLLADKIGKHRLFIIMAFLVLIPIGLITNLPDIPFYYVLCITGFWFVVSTGRMIPVQAMVSNVVPPEGRGSFMSLNSSIQQVFVGMASVAAGLIVVKTPSNTILNYNITGYISIAVTLVSIAFVTILNNRLKRREVLKPESNPANNELVIK